MIILAQAGIARERIETDPGNPLRLKGTDGVAQNIHFNPTWQSDERHLDEFQHYVEN